MRTWRNVMAGLASVGAGVAVIRHGLMLLGAASLAAAAPPAPPRPKLVVAISVDQFSAELFDRYRGRLTGGLGRMARSPNSGARVSIPVRICRTHKPSTVVVSTKRPYEMPLGRKLSRAPQLGLVELARAE